MKKLDKLKNDLNLCDEVIIDALRRRLQIAQELIPYIQAGEIPAAHPDEEISRKREFSKKLEDCSCHDSILDLYDHILYCSKQIQLNELFGLNVFLIGFMGVGKSTISRAFKEVFAMDVIEMDEIIAERNGMSISEIFDLHGEQYFRNEETKLLQECKGKKNQIVSCGGGVAMRQVNVDEMKKSGVVVLLTASPDTILERVESSHDRPLLENNKTVGHISEMMERRRPAYEAAADITVSTNSKSAYEICEEIISKVSNFKTQAQEEELSSML